MSSFARERTFFRGAKDDHHSAQTQAPPSPRKLKAETRGGAEPHESPRSARSRLDHPAFRSLSTAAKTRHASNFCPADGRRRIRLETRGVVGPCAPAPMSATPRIRQGGGAGTRRPTLCSARRAGASCRARGERRVSRFCSRNGAKPSTGQYPPSFGRTDASRSGRPRLAAGGSFHGQERPSCKRPAASTRAAAGVPRGPRTPSVDRRQIIADAREGRFRW